MEKDFGSWFLYQHFEKQSYDFYFSSDLLDVGRHSCIPGCMNPHSNEVSIKGTFPSIACAGLPQSEAGQPSEPHNWFYCMPHFQKAFVPPLSSVPKEKFPLPEMEICGRPGSPNTGTGLAQKRFLVFDQSGDQTKLVYSYAPGAPVQCPITFNPKPPAAYDPIKEDLEIKGDIISQFSPFLSNEHNEEKHGVDGDSQLHEDTEELNALLYSDDENEDDDEVTSTGHSPSTMTNHGLQEWFEERDEEVASCSGPTKRRKLLAGDYDVPSPMIHASSVKFKTLSQFEADAESNSGNSDNQASEGSISLSGGKRLRKEKIQETVSILESIIPGGKGKDATVVIDEAIHYLKSLRVKAKSLGLDAL